MSTGTPASGKTQVVLEIPTWALPFALGMAIGVSGTLGTQHYLSAKPVPKPEPVKPVDPAKPVNPTPKPDWLLGNRIRIQNNRTTC